MSRIAFSVLLAILFGWVGAFIQSLIVGVMLGAKYFNISAVANDPAYLSFDISTRVLLIAVGTCIGVSFARDRALLVGVISGVVSLMVGVALAVGLNQGTTNWYNALNIFLMFAAPTLGGGAWLFFRSRNQSSVLKT